MKTTTTTEAAAIGVRGVLAGAYRGRGLDKTLLTHAVVLDADGIEYRTLCRRPIENICDEVESGPPTCPTCAKRAAKW